MPEIDPAEVCLRYQRIGVSTISDILDRKGYTRQAIANDITPLGGPETGLVGFAYTFHGEMVPWEGPNDPVKIKALDHVSAHSVTVWSCGSIQGVCVFGDLLAAGMQQRGCRGAIVDGGVRDSAAIVRMGFPVFTRYRTPVQSTNRWRVTGSQISVPIRAALGGTVTVNPGDLVVGDWDGALIIPQGLILEVLEEAEALLRTEEQARGDLNQGEGFASALNKYGRL